MNLDCERENEMAKILEGLWDCPYCGQKGIGGLTKACPNCTHPQDEDTVFYMGSQRKVLDEETAKNYGQGADWICPYCNSLNKHNAGECVNCGAMHEVDSIDYKQKRAQEELEKRANPPVVEETAEQEEKRIEQTIESKNRRSKLLFILAAVVILLIIIGMPKKKSFTLSEKSWNRDIEIEQSQTVKEDGWSEPAGARCYDEKEEVYEYDQIVDHYDTVQVEKTREVQDGYDTEIEYIDNGDGTFTENEVKTPKYVTETYYETEEQPVYKDVPVYKTKHYYEIDKWVVARTISTSGKDDAPVWGEVTLADGEREGNHKEKYTVTYTGKKGKTYTADVSEAMWNELKIGDKDKVTVKGSTITAIDGKPVK